MNVDTYISRNFYSLQDIEQLPPCVLVDKDGCAWTWNAQTGLFYCSATRLTSTLADAYAPFRVTHLIELHEVPVPKSDAPEFTVDMSRRFVFEVRSSLSDFDRVWLLTIESPYGKWWQATLESSQHSSLHLSDDEAEPWQYSGPSSQFATAEEALAAAWATPEIKGLT